MDGKRSNGLCCRWLVPSTAGTHPCNQGPSPSTQTTTANIGIGRWLSSVGWALVCPVFGSHRVAAAAACFWKGGRVNRGRQSCLPIPVLAHCILCPLSLFSPSSLTLSLFVPLVRSSMFCRLLTANTSSLPTCWGSPEQGHSQD